MMYPILPQSTSGGSDPALEGRVSTLENDVANLNFVEQNIVSKDGSFSSIAVLFSSHYEDLPDSKPLTDLGVTLPATVEFIVDDIPVTFHLNEGAVIWDLISEFRNSIAVSSPTSAIDISFFAKQIKIAASVGSYVSFPVDDYNGNIWAILGLANFEARSRIHEPSVYISHSNVYGVNGALYDELLSSSAQITILESALSRAIDTIQSLQNRVAALEAANV